MGTEPWSKEAEGEQVSYSVEVWLKGSEREANGFSFGGREESVLISASGGADDGKAKGASRSLL